MRAARGRAGSQLHAQVLHALVQLAITSMAADVIEPSCKAHPRMRNCLHEQGVLVDTVIARSALQRRL